MNFVGPAKKGEFLRDALSVRVGTLRSCWSCAVRVSAEGSQMSKLLRLKYLVKVVEAPGVETGGSANDSMDFITFAQKQFRPARRKWHVNIRRASGGSD